jgi:hypothetical protein
VAKGEGESPDNLDEFKAPNEKAGAAEPSEEALASLFQNESLFTTEEPQTAEEPIAAEVPPVAEESQAAEETAAKPAEAEGQEAAAESAGEGEEEPATEEKPEPKPAKWPFFVEWGAIVGVPVILLGIAFLHLLYFATVIYVVSVALIPYAIWKGRQTNSVYTVILGCALVAVLTAVYCLWLEVGRYQFDIKAREAKQRVSMSVGIDAGFLVESGSRRSDSSGRTSA